MLSFIFLEEVHSSGPGVEELVNQAVSWAKLGIEAFGSLIITLGGLIAIYKFIRAIISRDTRAYYSIRLQLSRFLALALEFQLAADILGTAISPGWTQLGKLGVIAVLRTALNYFLAREMKEEEEQCDDVPSPRTEVAAKHSAA